MIAVARQARTRFALYALVRQVRGFVEHLLPRVARSIVG